MGPRPRGGRSATWVWACLEKIAARTGRGALPGERDEASNAEPAETTLTFRVSPQVAVLFQHAVGDLSLAMGRRVAANQALELLVEGRAPDRLRWFDRDGQSLGRFRGYRFPRGLTRWFHHEFRDHPRLEEFRDHHLNL